MEVESRGVRGLILDAEGQRDKGTNSKLGDGSGRIRGETAIAAYRYPGFSDDGLVVGKFGQRGWLRAPTTMPGINADKGQLIFQIRHRVALTAIITRRAVFGQGN